MRYIPGARKPSPSRAVSLKKVKVRLLAPALWWSACCGKPNMSAVPVDLASKRVNPCDPAHMLRYGPARNGAPPPPRQRPELPLQPTQEAGHLPRQIRARPSA